MRKIKLPCLGATCFVYFDYEEFKKNHIEKSEWEKYGDEEGLSAGNGIYVDLNGEQPLLTGLHELSHFIDWLFVEQFPQLTMETGTEIRARVTVYLYEKLIKIIEKNIDRLKDKP